MLYVIVIKKQKFHLINCEINLILTYPEIFVVFDVPGATTFEITGTKNYIPLVTFSIQDNAKLLQQLKSDLKEQLTGTKITKKYQSKLKISS